MRELFPLRTLFLVLPFAVSVFACSSSKSSASPDPGAGDAGGAPLTDSGAAPIADSGAVFSQDSGSGNQVGCSDASKLVYVVSKEHGLYSFDPTTVTTTLIGQITCPTGGADPNSMAVDRTGTAWVQYTDGSVWKVSSKDASCIASPYAADQLSFHTFGMGYASNDTDVTKDTLFIDDHDGKGLAKVDVNGTATPIAAFGDPLQGRNCELTGTGDGRLFGFFTTLPASVAEIDKATGAILSNDVLTNVNTGSEWAFSFWGGDFYLYTAQASGSGLPQNDTGSTVTRYRPSDKSVTVLKQNIGFRIVGAGVSTCAPTTSPK